MSGTDPGSEADQGSEADADGDGGGPSTESPDRRLDEQREEYRDLVEDVRERVIQVKRETDTKAEAETVGALDDRVADVTDDLETLRADLASLEDRVDGGFENFESSLTGLVDELDDLRDRLDTLATALVGLREDVATVREGESARRAAADLKVAANREGVATAACEECSGEVRVGLLADPECPHCASRFVDLEPKRGIFGSATLATGDPPALDAGDEATPLDDLDGGDPE
jgi:hypothetical protein